MSKIKKKQDHSATLETWIAQVGKESAFEGSISANSPAVAGPTRAVIARPVPIRAADLAILVLHMNGKLFMK